MLLTTHQLFKVLVLPLLCILLVRSLYSQPGRKQQHQHVFQQASGVDDGLGSKAISSTLAAEQIDFWRSISGGEENDEDSRQLRGGVSMDVRCALLTSAATKPKPNTQLGREWAACSRAKNILVAPASSRCREMMRLYRVKPGSSWGSLPVVLQKNWTQMRCDDVVSTSVANFRRRNNEPAPRKRVLPPLTDCPVPTNETLPLIALCCGTTTRTKKGWVEKVSKDLATLALFKHLLPSFKNTLECGFRYVVVVGYDVGDRWWDAAGGEALARAWFEDFRRGLRKNVQVTLELTRVKNTVQKPGPVFTAVTKRAYDVGADYLYRVNDDTELADPWANRFVAALRRLDNVGVVGPMCKQGNRRILTHDFTHRGHMDIFDQTYYPAELSDWWMDDWISRVYGPRRTWRDDRVEAIHHTQHHGQRYVVDKSHATLLDDLVRRGQDKINKHLEKHAASLTTTSSSSFSENVYVHELWRGNNDLEKTSSAFSTLQADGYSSLDSSPEAVNRRQQRRRVGRGVVRRSKSPFPVRR